MVETASGRLKARWRYLSVCLEVFFENVNAVECACVALYKICEEKGHAVLEDLDEPATFMVQEEDGPLTHRQSSAQNKAEGGHFRNALAQCITSINNIDKVHLQRNLEDTHRPLLPYTVVSSYC